MFVQGKWIDHEINEDIVRDILLTSSITNDHSIFEIIDVLDLTSKLWCSGSDLYNEAVKLLEKELSFDIEMIKTTLDILPEILKKDFLIERFSLEIGSPQGMDRPILDENTGRVLFSPKGKVLHVTAGNVFLGFVDSLIMGLITKNLSFIKLSSSNLKFPKLFLQSIETVDVNKILLPRIVCLTWKGGDKGIENQFKKSMDMIIAWGGEEMVSSYKKELPLDTKLIDHGPKISIGVLDQTYIDNNPDVYDGIAKDVSQWDQAACANMQNLFIADDVEVKSLLEELSKSFEKYPIKRGRVSKDEAVEILKEKSKANMTEFKTQVSSISSDEYFIRFDDKKVLTPSALNRTLIIKKFSSISELTKMLSTFKFYMQTCAFGISQDVTTALSKLSTSGIKRFTKFGQMLEGINGAAHDGQYALSNFVNIVSVEFQASKEELVENKPSNFGKVRFATGGTTGNPKFSLYTNQEFDFISTLLSKSFKLRGINHTDTVANLFVAGNMWSSFIAVYKALEKTDATQLPIGGGASTEDIISYLKRFKPRFVFGIPSLIYELAVNAKEENIQIENFFYAGEQLLESQKKTISESLGVENYYSACYACVDTGPIAYQDETCSEGEHILFDGVYLSEKDGEAYITSSIKEVDKIIDYPTGDLVEIINDKRFILKGRKNPLILIWGARITVAQIQESLESLGYFKPFQIIIKKNDKEVEVLEIRLEIPVDPVSFTDTLVKVCPDVRQTVDKKIIKERISLERRDFEHNARTKKTKVLIDKR